MSNGREFHCFGAQQEENRVLAESSNLNTGMHHASSSYKMKRAKTASTRPSSATL